jgi:hypothetical protein
LNYELITAIETIEKVNLNSLSSSSSSSSSSTSSSTSSSSSSSSSTSSVAGATVCAGDGDELNPCRSSAVVYCTKCEAYLCPVHKQTNHSTALLKKHEIISVAEQSTREAQQCQTHHKALDLFCTHCDVACCHLCPFDSHKEHSKSIILMKEKATKSQERLGGLISTLQEVDESLEAAITECQVSMKGKSARILISPLLTK